MEIVNCIFLLASCYGNLEVVKTLLERGANIEAKEWEYGSTPLILGFF